MAGNNAVDVAFDRKWGPMRSSQRARYEFMLAAAARQLRNAVTMLRATEQLRAADELELLQGMLEEEVFRSLRGKRPMSTRLTLSDAAGPSQSALRRDSP